MPRDTPLQTKHELEYGLKIVERNPDSTAVVTVRCQFCFFFEKEERAGAKRSRTQSVKYFKHPFRSECYRSHLVGQHSAKWAEYSALDDEGKKTHFKDTVPMNNTLAVHFAGESPLKLVFKKCIVEDLIGGLFFNEEDEDQSKTRALKVFKPIENDDDNVSVTIKSAKMFRLVAEYISHGATFHMASNLVASTRKVTGLACYTGCTTL